MTENTEVTRLGLQRKDRPPRALPRERATVDPLSIDGNWSAGREEQLSPRYPGRA